MCCCWLVSRFCLGCWSNPLLQSWVSNSSWLLREGCIFAGIAITRDCKWIIEILFPYSSGSYKSKIKILTELILFWGFSSWLINDYLFPLSSDELPSVYICVFTSSSYKDTSYTGLGPTLKTPFYHHYLLQCPVSKYSHILRYWAFKFQCMTFEGKTNHNRVI